jgi:hypothetical protein
MRVLKISSACLLVATVACISQSSAQQPTSRMVVVQPAGSTTAPAAAAGPAGAPVTAQSDAVANALKLLDQIKANNDATLKKQEAMLQQLDELQKAAEQLKVFSKRV